jgi:hypothetical protein
MSVEKREPEGGDAVKLGWALLWVTIAGGFGGLVNAMTSSNGFLLPRRTTEGGAPIWQAGAIGTVVVGAFAAAVNWGLYGPFTDAVFGEEAPGIALNLASVATAALVGYAGARWLTNEVDKKLLQAAAGKAAGSAADSSKAAEIATATPAGALDVAASM